MHAFAAVRQDGSVVTWGEIESGGDSSKVREHLQKVQQAGVNLFWRGERCQLKKKIGNLLKGDSSFFFPPTICHVFFTKKIRPQKSQFCPGDWGRYRFHSCADGWNRGYMGRWSGWCRQQPCTEGSFFGEAGRCILWRLCRGSQLFLQFQQTWRSVKFFWGPGLKKDWGVSFCWGKARRMEIRVVSECIIFNDLQRI